MPEAARVSDATQHGSPLNPGIGSPNVKIGFMPAWRALPKGMGAGVEEAADTMKDLMGSASLDIGSAPAKLAKVFAALMQDAPKAAAHGAPAAPGAVAGGFTTLIAANVALTAAYVAGAAVPGGEPAARTAYTEGIKAAAAGFAAASMSAIAGVTDSHLCPVPAGIPPHGPGVVTKASKSVYINNLPAARKDDRVFEALGGADPVAVGCPTVFIGDDGGGPGPSSDAAGGASQEQTDKQQEQQEQARSTEAALIEAAATGVALVEVCPQCAQIERAAATGPPTGWVLFRLVRHDTGEPLAGARVRIRRPDGTGQVYTTNQHGEIEIDDLRPAAGTCAVEAILDRDAWEVLEVNTRPV